VGLRKKLTHTPRGLATWQQIAIIGLFTTVGGWAVVATVLPSVKKARAAELPALSGSTDSQVIQPALEIQLKSAYPEHRIGVHNPSNSVVARNVEVWIERITAYDIEKVLPHRLRTRDGNKTRADINPDTTEFFEFVALRYSKTSDEYELQISGLRLNRLESENIILKPGKHPHIFVKVCCANAAPQRAIFYATVSEPSSGLGFQLYRIDDLI